VRRFGVLMSTSADDPVGQARIAAFRQRPAKICLDRRRKCADRYPLGWRQCRPRSQIRDGVGRAYPRCYFGHGEPDCGGLARGEPHRANRVRARCRGLMSCGRFAISRAAPH
jgi:hypothetical protein